MDSDWPSFFNHSSDGKNFRNDSNDIVSRCHYYYSCGVEFQNFIFIVNFLVSGPFFRPVLHHACKLRFNANLFLPLNKKIKKGNCHSLSHNSDLFLSIASLNLVTLALYLVIASYKLGVARNSRNCKISTHNLNFFSRNCEYISNVISQNCKI